MVDAIRWAVGDPWHYAWIIGFLCFVGGIIVGRTAKTNKLEIRLRDAESDLNRVLRTIELKRGAEDSDDPVEYVNLVTTGMSENGVG